MILQRDGRLRESIREYGCYYMSLLYFANKYSNAQLCVQKINGVLYYDNIREGNMNSSCFVSNPSGILQSAGLDAEYTGVHEAPIYVCGPREFEILYFKHPKSGGHFTAGDGNGNVSYDPWGVSISATEGELISKRIFRLK